MNLRGRDRVILHASIPRVSGGEPYSVRVRCPYYETMASDTKKQATITCQNICCNLGFEIKNQIVFTCHEEKSNFAGIFCEDMYETCPYFKGIYKTQMEDEKK